MFTSKVEHRILIQVKNLTTTISVFVVTEAWDAVNAGSNWRTSKTLPHGQIVKGLRSRNQERVEAYAKQCSAIASTECRLLLRRA